LFVNFSAGLTVLIPGIQLAISNDVLAVHLFRQSANYLFEKSPAMLIALELIEAGAGGSKQDNVARDGPGGRTLQCRFQSFRVHDLGSAADLRFYLGGGGADRVHLLYALPQ
jgi:hypothetical protein